MAKVVKKWGNGSVSIAVEYGKDDANHELTHVHVYKNSRRTNSRVPGNCRDIDNKDAAMAEKLYYDNLREIERLYQDVKNGKYGD